MKKRRATSTAAPKKKPRLQKRKRRAAMPPAPSRIAAAPGSCFPRAASRVAHWAGKPIVFLSAVLLVLIWALTGPLFGFSDTWQLVINTSTTIVTFLMVFLIQNTQNRDTLALQLKLAELIITLRGAKNGIATAEDLSEEELERLHDEYRDRAEDTLEHLNRRRGEYKRAS